MSAPAAAPPSAPPLAPRRVLAQMLVGNQLQQAVHVAARLGVADLLGDGPRPAEELAREAGAHPGALRRLLRALAAFGVFAEDAEGRWELTPAAALLRAGEPGSMRAFALWSGGVSYRVFGALEHSVRTGEPAFDHLFGAEFFEYLAGHPEDGAVFDEMMAWNTAPVAPVVAARFSGVETVVDVGGGRGELLAGLLAAHPAMRGVLFDHPRVAEGAARALEAAGVADRCRVVCGDMLESVPGGGDAYLLKSVLHGLDDGTAARVLRNCRRAAGGGGRLLLVEFVLPPGNDPFPGKLMDLLMLVGGRGRERTEDELRSLLGAAGFRLAEVVPTRYGLSVIEAEPA